MIHHSDVLYQIVTDRFHHPKRNLEDLKMNPRYDKLLQDHCGGSFLGIEAKVDHLVNLGVNHVLISPVAQSSAYHGYHTTMHFDVNQTFGSSKELKSMIGELHKKGIGVMLDYAAAHTHISSPLVQEHPSWFHIPKGTTYYDELHYKLTSGDLSGDSTHRTLDSFSFFDDPNLPLLNLTDPDVVNFHQQVLNYWITEYGFDNVRLDSAFLHPRSFTEALTDHVHQAHPEVQVFAEYWSFRPNGSARECYGVCDGEFGIPITLALNRGPQSLFKDLVGIMYEHHRIRDYPVIVQIDSHDTPRFQGNIEDQKMAAALQFLLPWQPMMYYGNETGMREENTHPGFERSRDVMKFTPHPLIDFYRQLVDLRQEVQETFTMPVNAQINDDGQLFTCTFQTPRRELYVVLNRDNRDFWINTEHLFGTKDLLPYDLANKRKRSQSEERVHVSGKGTHVFSNR